ncbi:phage tail protein [Paenibacillus sp. GCM10023252]|uniref:phage tail protein n=1 Tax=Paenibacillus sp. GCM10023252 TaxID=3252649 RepID=UPI003607EC82
MADPFIGELKVFPIGFTPKNWAPCNGQLLAINTNQALFSLLGVTYGGDGVTTFALPNLRGRVPIHTSPTTPLGMLSGEENHTLTESELQIHGHMVNASSSPASAAEPAGQVWAHATSPYGLSADTVTMNPSAVQNAGGGQPHSNMQPYLGLQFCIALQGIYPSRN